MSKRKKRPHALEGAAVAACLLAALTAEGWGNALASAFELPRQPAAPVALAVQKVDRPALEALEENPGEDPLEDEKITAALEAAGYYRADVPLSCELQDALHTACARYGVDYALALGLIEVESGFDPTAVSPHGCYGLMQLSPRYFPAGLGPEENIEAGVAYLAEQISKYGGAEAGLTAYNAGTDTGGRAYASAVLAAAEAWKEARP